ncbi:hypothetical protein CLH62_06165 [Marinobacter guineae]|uniref:Uncharacterized protein n=1 Tax=Marinobacter guineae TaxID=432303 RepID=A0A2G1VK85_9GAMM|nr:tautomerase family protein [Marinobacter guineae]PHQ27158.1 hypothetical protein CLH62_06165 [Marinobacter guineae]
MPIITVSLANSICSSQDKQQAIKRVAERLTESTVRVLRKNRELIVVRFSPLEDAEHWFVAGKPLRAQDGPISEVNIKITDGTNQKDEISAWIREAFETLIQELGESVGPNYVSVNDLCKNKWGYDGITQYGREMWAS